MADETTYYTTDDTGGYVAAELPSFRDQIPEELRESEHLKDYGDAGALAQALHDLKSTQPQIPESADGYVVPEIPEGIPADTEAIEGFKALAHELKLPQDAVDKIIAFDLARAKKYADMDKAQAEEALAAIKKNRETAQAELDKEWGADKAKNTELVAKVKTRFLSEDTLKRWDESGFSDDPDLIRMLAKFGSVIDEGHLILPGTRPSGEIQRTADGTPILRYDKSP